MQQDVHEYADRVNEVIMRETTVRVPTQTYNTICTYGQCHSNCHVDCLLYFDFAFDTSALSACWVMQPSGLICHQCHHSLDNHRHLKEMWTREKGQETTIDGNALDKLNVATARKKEITRELTEDLIYQSEHLIKRRIEEVNRLAEEHGKLSLSGGFAAPLQDSLKLFDLALEVMRDGGGESQKIMKQVETSRNSIMDRLNDLQN